jgi:glucose/arabinose dehydrogenase
MATSRSQWGRALAALACAAAVGLAAASPGTGSGPHEKRGAGVRKQEVGTFNQPIYAARAPGVGDRIYVVERQGTVRAADTGGGGEPLFLDIHGRVSTAGERGLLSIAFDPKYQRTGAVFAYYTNNDGNLEIDRFRTSSDTDAREGTRRKVIEIPHPGASNHNGGTIAFGKDGYLYLATGDGGTGGANAQSRGSLLGKLLRIKPHRHGAGHSSPRGNPFVGRSGLDEIYAMGLRNPFRWSFDHRRITIGDVGETTWEEVDYEGRKSLRAANFGWPRYEGDHHNGGGQRPHNYRAPIFEYRHGDRGNVITGGLVVRDPKLRRLEGRYLYADYSKGQLRSFIPKRRGARRDRRVGVDVQNPSSFTAGPGKQVYITSLTGGKLYRLVRRR